MSLWLQKGATEHGMPMINFKKCITMCVSSCSLAVSGSPPVGFDAESWVSILVSSKRKSSISLWKPWAFWEKTLGRSVVNSSFQSKLSKWSHKESLREESGAALRQGCSVAGWARGQYIIFTIIYCKAESFMLCCNRDVWHNLMNWLRQCWILIWRDLTWSKK